MISVKALKEKLNKYSDDNMIYAYEGESDGLGIVNKENEAVGFIHASQNFNVNEDERFDDIYE